MRTSLIAVSVFSILTGCASLQNAGNFSVTIDPKTGATQLTDGKQYASVKGDVTHTPDGGYVAHFEAMGVEAFQGQKIAAEAAKQIALDAAKAAIAAAALATPGLVSSVGGLISAPGAGAAAAGAAGVIGVQKILPDTPSQ